MPTPNPTKKTRSASEIWADPTTLATPLLALFLDTYGGEKDEKGLIVCLDWDPETIHMEIEEDFHIQLPRVNHDKLMMAILVKTTDRFYKILDDFIHVCNVFSGSAFDPRIFDPADAMECAWGITEVLLLEPPEEDEPFTEEIRRYIGQVVEAEGLLDPPDVLKLGIRTQALPGSGFTEDPEMYSAVWGAEKLKSDDIRRSLKERLALLIRQMLSLPLQRGSAEQLAQKIIANPST